MHRPVSITALLLAAAMAVPARADVVELADGALFEGTVTQGEGRVLVRTASGSTMEFEAAKVREVRPGGWRDEYQRRRAAAPSAGADERYRLGLWCGSKGLAGEQEAELRAALQLDPAHRAARERLGVLELARLLPATNGGGAPPAPAPPASHETAHIRAAADGGEGLAREVAEMAESAVTDFVQLFELPGDSAAVRGFRVKVRYYSRLRDYEEARRAAGAGGGSGFFSHTTGECHISCEADGQPPGMTVRQTIRHEVAHALALRVLGVRSQRRWLAEALATVMEGTDADGLGGGMIWTRLSMASRAADDSGGSLAVLLGAGSGPGGAMSLDDYARIWSFAHFIFYGDDARERARLLAPRRQTDPADLAVLGRTRKESFLAMLAEVREGGYRADVDGIFRRHFPDSEALEAAWRAHVAKLVETRLRPAAIRRPFVVRRTLAPAPAPMPVPEPARTADSAAGASPSGR